MSPVRVLPTEVELAIDLQPCLAERRTYERADRKHPCEFFADQGSFHSFDLQAAGPGTDPTIEQPAAYAGRRRVSPEMLSGCRKAPIMSVGINPNLPGYWAGRHNSVLPVFDDVLQYAQHFRYRGVAKLQIPENEYETLLAGRIDGPLDGPPLTDEGVAIGLELANQRMYLAYQSLLDGLCDGMEWERTLSVGEDLSYGNMVACGSPRWITRLDPEDPSLPVMTLAQQRGIVQECFFERRHFLRQLFQSLPRVLLVFGAATRDAFIRAMEGHFVEGDPQVGEDLSKLLDRRITLKFGEFRGRALQARVLFVPHASGNAAGFAAVQAKVIAALVQEAHAGRLERAGDGHLRRPEGGCMFCSNALYHIGKCDYVDQLRPLNAPLGQEEAGEAIPMELRERAAQTALLDAFLSGVAAPVVSGSSAIGHEEAESGGAPQLYVLRGRVVTMSEAGVIERGAVYIYEGILVAVQDADEPAPQGFDDAPIVDTQGTIYPGLIDLHNHVPYNILTPWAVPEQFQDRNQWRRRAAYRRKMQMMQRFRVGRPAMAVARYVEVKALLGGITAIQGMRSTFKTASGSMDGLVRNVETSGKNMPGAGSNVQDLDLSKGEVVDRFRRAVNNSSAAFFYHLCEGHGPATQQLWRDLDTNNLLGPGLVGIHSLGVPSGAYERMAQVDASVVWSPTSNLMLYGQTLDWAGLVRSGVRWTIGCDWAPTGARNPLFELKIARALTQGAVSDYALVASVTNVAAHALRWNQAVGQLTKGYHADLIVVRGQSRDAYAQLVGATEQDIVLVMVDGVPRAGTAEIFDQAGVPRRRRESVDVGTQTRQLWLREPGTTLHDFTLSEAVRILRQRMRNPVTGEEESAELFGADAQFEIVLDDEMAPLSGPAGVEEAGEDEPVIDEHGPDPLTVAGDTLIWDTLAQIEGFPADLREAVQSQYARTVP